MIMKKLLRFKKMMVVFLLVGMSSAGWAQILYEGFNYATPAFIGGNGDPGATSNNWVTHSVTAGETTTLDIENGSLDYAGLLSSTGNKLYFFSNANKTSRDVNRALPANNAKILYFSALVNIIDNTQINAFDNYFMHFSANAGATGATFGGRLGTKAVGSPTTSFRFVISNISGGTPTYTDNGTDLVFGTTYLVVVKYNISAAVTEATMWVNPVSLGGTEPAGGISNNSGTNAFTTFASICIRNNATTPKAYIDEIRVGDTWASVTPIGGNVGFAKLDQARRQTSVYPNPATTSINVKAPEGKYIVTVKSTIGSVVKSVELNSAGKIETSELRPGIYFITIENQFTSLKEVHKLIIK